MCPSCGDHQFARNVQCRRCGAPSPNLDSAFSAGVPHISSSGASHMAAHGKPGDWLCPSCGDHQFAKNQACRRCGTPNPNPQGNMAAFTASIGMTHKPGDWFCPSCSDLQFARNMQCKRCGTPNPNPTNQYGNSLHMKPGDWLCPRCGDLQFAKNAACRKCGTPNPDPEGTAHAAMERGDFHRGPVNAKPGDWNCPACGDHQFARNTHCRRCGTPNPNGGGGFQGFQGSVDFGRGGDMGRGRPMGRSQWDMGAPMGAPPPAAQQPAAAAGGPRKSSWRCPSCNTLVFGRNDNCTACGTARPEQDASARDRSRSPRPQQSGAGVPVQIID